MAERTIIQWDKDDLDALGLLKVDVLALGMLSAIRRALDEVSRLRGRTITMADIPREDPAVYEMIGHADTVGVFQIESRAQMSMLPRLRPRNFYDLVIEVAIVRPGPIQGGMVHPYLRRREGSEPVTYPSEAVREVLQRTLGVPIFQEQVMRLTVVAAGFTPGEADQVRRSMAAWKRKGGLEHIERRLIDGMTQRGYEAEFALQIYQQILGFGEYGFPESHAASFALLVYISAWLKCYEPAAFACALINSQPMGFYAPAQLVQDARRHGVEVLPADVTTSDWDCTLSFFPSPANAPSPRRGEGWGEGRSSVEGQSSEDQQSSGERKPSQPSLRLGLRMVNGLSLEGAASITTTREQAPFTSIEDLATRCSINKHDLKSLATAGALSTIAGHRRQVYWDVAGIEQNTPLAFSPVEEQQPQLLPLTEGQNLVADYDSLGLTLGRHPLALLRDTLRAQRLVTAAELRTFPHGRLTRAAGLVIGRQRPGTASGVTFVTLEDETGQINVVVWRDLGERQRRELLGSRLLAVYGVLERQGEVAHLIAGHLKDLTPLLGDLVTQSRDFH
jgi:error-prone DNA polymerase